MLILKDALGGTVDLSPYAKTEVVNGQIQTVNQEITKLDSKVGKFSGATVAEFTSLKQYADNTFATKTELQTAQNNITTAYTNAIGSAKDEVYTSATTFATNAVNTAKNALNQAITGLSSNVTSLSSSTVSIKATADKAVQTASIVDGATCKVSVSKVNTELQFDFRNIVIDCGDF